MKETTLIVPAHLFATTGKKGKLEGSYLNLNNYRNWNHFKSSKIKKKFNHLLGPQMWQLPKMNKIKSIEYTLIVPTKAKRDRMNVYSIVDKFFCDVLQKYGKIEDDSDEFIEEFIFKQTIYRKDERHQIKVQIKIVSY